MAQLSHLMLFDPDPSGLDILTFGFEKEGCTVEGTADPVKAWQLAQRPVRALLVVSLKEADPSGINLIRATTSNPKTRNLACVAIGREDARAAALAAGAFVFLSVPVFARDIINVCRLVAAATVPGSRPSPKTEISLKLAEMAGVYFLMRALLVAGRSAAVELRREGRRGELRFIDGSLSSAQLGSLEGLPALHRMLLWDDAGLTFKFKNVARRGTQLSMKSSEVTEECDRFLRDFAHEANDLGSARTVYAPNMKNLQPSTAFPSEVLPLLRLFDGRRDLSHVLEESPFRIFDTLKIVKRFVTDHALRATTPLPPGRETTGLVGGPSALDGWLQRQAPALGAEMGRPMETAAGAAPAPLTPPPPTIAGVPEEAVARAAAIAGMRPSSPFVAVPHDQGPLPIPADLPPVAAAPAPTQFGDKFEETAHGIRRTNFEEVVDANGVPVRRPRTITQRERTLHVPGLVLPSGPRTKLAPPSVTPPISTPHAVAQPPVAGLVPALQVTAPAPAKQGGVVARGEIRIATLTPPAMLAVPAAAASVVIDMDPPPAALPTARPLVSHAPIPVTAAAQVVRLPSVIVAPMTPPPVLIAPPPVAVAPPPVAVASPPIAVAPPPVAVAPPPVSIAPPRVMVAPAQVAVAPPPTSERPRNGTPASGVSTEARRAARSPSDNFDAIESDFFDREADLYKRESVESFEDLDGAARARRPNGSGPTRKP